jgi:hypothetical protein
LALLSPHFFFFRLLLPSSFDVDAVILLSSPSSYLLSPHKLPLHSFSGHSLLDTLRYHHPTIPDRPTFPFYHNCTGNTCSI